MTNSIDRTDKRAGIDPFEIKRDPVPDSTALQLRIITASQNLPQFEDLPVRKGSANSSAADRANIVFRKWFSLKPLLLGCAAGIAALALGYALLLPLQQAPLPGQQASAVVGIESTAPMDELAWQDLLLLQDEIAFAEL